LLSSKKLADLIAEAAADKKAEDILILNIGKLLVITDYFVICTAQTERQVKSITDHIREKISQYGLKPINVEGEKEARWVLLDYADVVVHVFVKEEREFYQLERLWKDAPQKQFAVDGS
jgi:ribosome-associated protein